MIVKKTIGGKLLSGINLLLLALFALVIVIPFYYIVVLSFNEGMDTLKGGLLMFPRAFTLDNYKTAFSYPSIMKSMFITVSRTAIVTSSALMLSSLLAYGLTFRTLPGRTFLSFFIYFTSIFGGGLVPTYILYRQLHILSTYWVLILPSLYSVWNIFILRTFFDGLPSSISESARIDGANETKIFFNLIFPLSAPVLATIALYIGVGAWNDWFTGQYFILMKDELQPAASLLKKLLGQSDFRTGVKDAAESGSMLAGADSISRGNLNTTTTESLRMAFLIIIIFPIMCVYPFLQKYFVKGALIGSIKG